MAVGALILGCWDDFGVQSRSENQRELLDAESVAGHLLKAGSVFAFLAAHRRELFPDEMFTDLFPTGRGRPSVPAPPPRPRIANPPASTTSSGENTATATPPPPSTCSTN